ncbi:hypothetical protein QUA40_04080 [Microcoleus sp. Pol11C3]|uniref:hypothetical protein n=1 Tax=Microcoleus sp. Pol11C3 TaxID=3055390 RepID=UPI002FCF5F74
MNLKQNFQNQIAESLFGANVSEERVCFLKRFAPKNHPDKRESTHKEIAKLMKNDLAVYCEEKINQTIRKVIEVVHKAYGEEMKADGVNIEALLNLKAGGTLKGKEDQESHKKFSPWKEAYKWLWNHKYLRWVDINGWEILKKQAKTAPDWIQFLTEQEMASVGVGTRALKPLSPRSYARKIDPTIPINQPLSMRVDLAYPNYQMLLFYRSAEMKYILCPSLGYAPNGVNQPPMTLPQEGSVADDNKERFTFEELGKEEFLAIAVEKPFNLDWLIPREEEALPEWNAERLKELFEQLERDSNWQVFYQSFEVVETA